MYMIILMIFIINLVLIVFIEVYLYLVWEVIVWEQKGMSLRLLSCL